MKNTIVKLFLLLLTITSLSSCKKWLEVQPEDRFTEEQIFSNPQGFEDAINGIYINLGKSNLYGKTLTMSLVDVLGQRYLTNISGHEYAKYATYEYTDEVVRGVFDGIWSDLYMSIANSNRLLVNVDRYKQNVSESRGRQIKAEALGLRAFLHFDLLRLFGPVYDSADSTKKAIPYYTELGADIKDIEPANVIVKKILADLNEAESLMADDPAKALGSSKNGSYRFNYFAVKALQARVLLWKKDNAGALNAAKTVISNANLFPWIVGANITGDNENPDRIFSTELLFAVYSKDMYTDYNKLYYYELSAGKLLSSGPISFLNKVYENNSNDYRKDYIWKVPPLGSPYPAFFKYADLIDKKKNYRNTIPLVRLSEMYYIAAETSTDPQDGLAYLNAVRTHRGIPGLITTTSLRDEIRKEYLKEFYGEGQLWYYYKRNKITAIVAANSETGVNVPASAWALPIPEEENSVR